MVCQVFRNPCLPAPHQKVWGLLCGGVWCAAVSPHDLRQHHVPFFLAATKEQIPEGVTQDPVIPLDDSVPLRVIWGGPTLVHLPYPAEVSHELGLELGTLVRMYLLG